MRAIPLIPETAPFTAAQRLWLNGYLAGLMAGGISTGGETSTPTPEESVRLLIMFGSQTGTAERVAKGIAREAKARNCDARVIDAAEFSKVDWKVERTLLVVTSTYGDGDMPDNAQVFWDWLQTESSASLAHLSFSVLALGDTNYEQFCAAGKKIDARLASIGAKRIHPIAECDLDYEAKSREWTHSVLEILTSSSPKNSDREIHPDINDQRKLDVSDERVIQKVGSCYSRSNPFPARLLTNRRLNESASQKETRHFEISIEGSELNYEAGDALGVLPRNCPESVNELLNVLGCNGNETVALETMGEVPFRHALTECFDISKPSIDLLQWVACHNAELRELLAADRKEHLKEWLFGREVIDLLLTIRNGKVPADEFVKLLKKLTPRLYSISSSPKAHGSEVHLTVGIVRYESFGRMRKGIASTFLADRTTDSPVPVYVQTSHGFRLPSSGATPVIMIGPGTGVAPFRAFLHERRAIGAKGGNWLFFGEQRASTDFYYQEELLAMEVDGHLKLSTAFSRDQKEKVYVQHRMIKEGAEIWGWLENGAHFYVCGDAARMAKDVDAALHEIVRKNGGKNAEEAAAYITRLKSDKRYQRDIY